MGEINKLKLIIAIIVIILGLMILLFELLWWQTYQTGVVVVGAASVFVILGGFYLIWRQFRIKSEDYKDIVADSEVQRKDIETEEPQEVKANKVWIGITLIVDGVKFLEIVGSILLRFGFNTFQKIYHIKRQYLNTKLLKQFALIVNRCPEKIDPNSYLSNFHVPHGFDNRGCS